MWDISDEAIFEFSVKKKFFGGEFNIIEEYFDYMKYDFYAFRTYYELNEVLNVLKKYSQQGTDCVINNIYDDTDSIIHKGDLVINSDLIIKNLIVTGNLTINGNVKVNDVFVVGDSLHFTQDLVVNTKLNVIGNNLTSCNASFKCNNSTGLLVIGGNIKIDGSLICEYRCNLFGGSIEIVGDLISNGKFCAENSSLKIKGSLIAFEFFKVNRLDVEKSIISADILEVPQGILSNENIYVSIIESESKIKYKKDIYIRNINISNFPCIEKI